MNKAVTIMTVFLLAGTVSISAQQAPKVVKIDSFTGAGLPPAELATLETMVTSYVIELKAFRVTDARGAVKALKELENALQAGDSKDVQTLSADYIISGNVGIIGDIFVFTLENTKVATGEKMSVTENCSGVGDIVLKARALTKRLFGKDDSAAASAQASSGTAVVTGDRQAQTVNATSINQVLGVWKGDKGLDSVRIVRVDGTAVGVLSGGVSMKLSVSVEDGKIVARQGEPNRPEFYLSSSIPYSMAKIIAERARPMRWVFSLSEDGKTLSGTKESVMVGGDRSGAVNVDNTFTREAVWIRVQ